MFRLTSQVFHQSQNEGPTSILAFNICQDLPRYIFSNLITCHLHVPCLIFKPFSLQISGHWTLAQQLMPLLVTVVWMKALKCHFLCTLAWKIPWTEEPGGLQSIGSQRVGHNWEPSLSCIRERNGNPPQCSCLENPRDGGAWWAAVYGAAQSRTRLRVHT